MLENSEATWDASASFELDDDRSSSRETPPLESVSVFWNNACRSWAEDEEESADTLMATRLVREPSTENDL
jgi:hypothetical protein